MGDVIVIPAWLFAVLVLAAVWCMAVCSYAAYHLGQVHAYEDRAAAARNPEPKEG